MKTKTKTKIKTEKGAQKHCPPYQDPSGGWTFIETLIVIGIILVLTSSVGFMAVKYLDRAKVVTAKSQIETFALSLDAYFLDCGEYPAELQGLSVLWEKPDADPGGGAWNGPYLNKAVPKDPWGNDYEYRSPGRTGTGYEIRSFGGDGLAGGEGNDADITSWE
ncbi:MAG: type II secretion system major pseudopilin GspG [Treponema sp.]|jgi:general secretion pathway protein G|nr:type II secretion system major pseudopilin GspG [Treponema sp.]